MELWGDDPDAFDPIAEYGQDPMFDDGDPSERLTPNPFDSVDTPDMPDEDQAEHRVAADVRIVRSGEAFEVIVNRMPRSTRDSLHAKQHDQLETVCRVVAEAQIDYLRTADEARRVPLTQAALVERSGIDKGTVQRLVTGDKRVELPWGEVVPLSHLLLDPTEARIAFIARLLRDNDNVVRDDGGDVVEVRYLLEKAEIVRRVQERFGAAGNSEPSVRAILKSADLPWDPDERRRRYEEGTDWWSWS